MTKKKIIMKFKPNDYPEWDEDNLVGDDMLLKISNKQGFLTGLNKDKTIPKDFKNWAEIPEWIEDRTKPKTAWGSWGGSYVIKNPLPIYRFPEFYRSGWKITDYRRGTSQDWVKVIHPLEFELEIYTENVFELIENNTIINGVIQGEFKWQKRKLIKK